MNRQQRTTPGPAALGMMRRFIALVLVLALSLGAMPVAALAGDIDVWDTASLDALGYAMYGDMANGYDDTFVIGILDHVLKSLIGNVENRVWDKLWESIFGKDDNGREVIQRLDEINRNLGKIMDELINLKKVLREDSLERRVDARKELMENTSTVLDSAFMQFDKADDAEDKAEALDIFFKYNPSGFPNAFYFFKNYCTMTAGTGQYQRVGYLDIYDRIADLKWNFNIESAPFRQMQRDSDIHFIARMASVLTLWLEKERAYGNVSKEAKNLDMYEQMLRTGLEDVIRALEEKAVKVDANTRTFYLHDGEAKQSFTFVTGSVSLIGGYKFDTHLKSFIQKRHDPQQVVERTTATISAIANDYSIPGSAAQLINRAEMDLLAQAARLRKMTVEELLVQGAKIPKGFTPKAAVTTNGQQNQPMHVGPKELDDKNNAMSALHRKIYFEYADLTKENAVGEPFYGSGRLDAWDSSMLGFAGNPGAHDCLLRDADNSRLFDDERFMLLYVTNSTVPAPEADAMDEADITSYAIRATIDSVQGDTLTAIADEASTGTLRLDSATEIVDSAGNPIADRAAIVGREARIDYHGEEAPYTASRIALYEEAAGQYIEGAVVRIETAAQIIGGNEDLVIDADGTEYIFDLIDGLVLAEGVQPGALVRVTYHNAQGGLLAAEKVELLSVPAPDTQTAEGTVADVHHNADMPGGLGLLVLDIPGALASFLVPMAVGLDEAIQEGASVRITYHSENGGNVADAVALLDMPGPIDNPDDGPMPGPLDDPDPAPVPQWAEGQVTAIVATPNMPGAPRTVTVMADREFTFTLPAGIDLAYMQVGDTVHVDFHEEGNQNMMDAYFVLMPGPINAPDDDPVVMEEETPDGVF